MAAQFVGDHTHTHMHASTHTHTHTHMHTPVGCCGVSGDTTSSATFGTRGGQGRGKCIYIISSTWVGQHYNNY